MYLTLSQPRLAHALTQVSHIAAHKSSALPILTQLVLSATPGWLEITASNGELGIHTRLEAEVAAVGQALLPARLLTDFVRDLPDASLTLAIPAPTDPHAAHVRCGQARATIKQIASPADEFPHVARVHEEATDELLVLDGELLSEIVSQVCFAAATDGSRPVLTGVYLDMRAGQAVFAAADAFRLATRTVLVPDTERTGSWIIPARTLVCLARLLASESSVQMLLSNHGKQILFHTTHLDLVSPLLEGVYPDIRQVIPTQIATRAVISTREFASAVRLMQPFGQHQVQLSLTQNATDGELTLTVTAPDVGTTDIRLSAAITGVDQSLHLTLTYLADALAAISTPDMCLELVNDRHPLLLKPVGSLDAVQVIMPRLIAATSMKVVATASASGSSVATH